jgi:hypothetical protein
VTVAAEKGFRLRLNVSAETVVRVVTCRAAEVPVAHHEVKTRGLKDITKAGSGSCPCRLECEAAPANGVPTSSAATKDASVPTSNLGPALGQRR